MHEKMEKTEICEMPLLSKMLDALNLKVSKKHSAYGSFNALKIDVKQCNSTKMNWTVEKGLPTVFTLKDENNCDARTRVGIGFGRWTHFVDVQSIENALLCNIADFETTTENSGIAIPMKTFDGREIKGLFQNPFFGCKSYEEAMVKADLLGI